MQGLTSSLLVERVWGFALVAGFLLVGLQAGCAGGKGDGVSERANVTPASAVVRLEELDLTQMDQGWGSAQAKRSVDRNPLTINGRVFGHGVGSHAESEMLIDLHGEAERLHAFVGVDDEAKEHGTVEFIVQCDDELAWRSGTLRGGADAMEVSVDLRGVSRLLLLIEDGGDNINYDHADWADATITMSKTAEHWPSAVRFPPGPPPKIAHDRSNTPRINPPRITGATPGRSFLFRIPTTGERPLTFSAENLPAGLELDPDNGIISGVLASEGETEVRLKAVGPYGEAAATLTIVGGEHQLALTPPMGWNSWNVWGTSVDDAKVRAAADWMVRSGLADCGYQYINIDDAWEADRDADGRIRTNEKFPDMKGLADYVHSKGLKLGIYSSPGPKTCAGYEGSYEHEFQDAETFAEWGIDLIKYDWCSYGDIAPDRSLPELRKPYELMREALDACGRDIVYSLCQYGMGEVSKWGGDVGGNYWRTTGDIVDTWSSLSSIGFSQAGLEKYAGPGHWNDPDMLIVGKVGWGPNLHDTRLSPNEQVTHITLWTLLASPMLVGCDLSQMDDFTIDLLANPEVIEVSQDPLGRQARRVTNEEDVEVWARPLSDGTLAVGVFNRGRGEAPCTVKFEDLGLAGPRRLRDLWQRKDLGTFEGEYEMSIPRHGAVFLKVAGGSAADLAHQVQSEPTISGRTLEPITEKRRQTLLVETNRFVDEVSSATVADLASQTPGTHLSYPPGVTPTADEVEALRRLSLSDHARSAMKKVVADACASVVFQHLCLMDGVAEPRGWSKDAWLGAKLAAPDGVDDPMLHDEFLDAYWDYAEAKKK